MSHSYPSLQSVVMTMNYSSPPWRLRTGKQECQSNDYSDQESGDGHCTATIIIRLVAADLSHRCATGMRRESERWLVCEAAYSGSPYQRRTTPNINVQVEVLLVVMSLSICRLNHRHRSFTD